MNLKCWCWFQKIEFDYKDWVVKRPNPPALNWASLFQSIKWGNNKWSILHQPYRRRQPASTTWPAILLITPFSDITFRSFVFVFKICLVSVLFYHGLLSRLLPSSWASCSGLLCLCLCFYYFTLLFYVLMLRCYWFIIQGAPKIWYIGICSWICGIMSVWIFKYLKVAKSKSPPEKHIWEGDSPITPWTSSSSRNYFIMFVKSPKKTDIFSSTQYEFEPKLFWSYLTNHPLTLIYFPLLSMNLSRWSMRRRPYQPTR